MISRKLFWVSSIALLFAVPVLGQTHHPRHSHFPNAPSNDPQLQIPNDQAQSCFTPESSLRGYDQFEQFDTYPQPASRDICASAFRQAGRL